VFEPGPQGPYPQKLSENRANSIVGMLTARGIAKTRVRPQGFGAYCTQPTATATSIELPNPSHDEGPHRRAARMRERDRERREVEAGAVIEPRARAQNPRGSTA